MNKNLILLAILIAVGGFAYWYFEKKESETSLEGYDFNFAVKDTANIGKIFIADRNGKTITLTRQNKNDWQLNGKFRANPPAINNILDAIARIELKYRLPRQAVATVVKDLSSQSVKVEIYDKSGEKIKSYYVGGADMDGKATYVMLDGSNEPYATHIPNWIGSLDARFFTEEMDWRDRFLYHLAPEDIQAVSLEYPLQKAKSFKLTRDGSSFKVEPFYAAVPRLNGKVNAGLVDAFLVQIPKLGIEGFESTYPKKDSVRAQMPFATLTITDKSNQTHALVLHPVFPLNTDGTIHKNLDGTITIERYFADANNGDFMMVQHYVFDKIFWAYEAFFGQTGMKN